MDRKFAIGATGHRFLPESALPRLAAEIRALLGESKLREGAENIAVLSSLALGADTLCARLALEAGLRLIAALPMPLAEYQLDFKEGRAELHHLLSLAGEALVVPPMEPVPPAPARGFFYRQAGIYVAKRCDALIAVWSGEEKDTPDGAGTWETIKLARKFGKPVFEILVDYDF